MPIDLETNIVDIDESALDNLFNEAPAGTPNANTLIGVKKDEEVVTRTDPKQPSVAERRNDIIEDVDLSIFDEEDEEEENTTKVVEKAAATKEDGAEQQGEDESSKASPNNKEGKASKDNDESKQEETVEVNNVLKSTVDFLISKGVWKDFEGREELEMTDEVYAQLVQEQDAVRVNSMFEELVDSTGPFGKAIIEFVKNGGSPDEIIDLFKEQKKAESIPIDSPEGQKDMIKHYYSEVLGWKPERVDKYVAQLMLAGELENESKEVKELFGNYYKKEAERLNKERSEYANQQKEAEKQFETNIRTSIKDRKDLSTGEKRIVEDYLLNYDQRLPNGNLVNKFYVNFAKMQANPQDYVDLVLFTMDKQKFVQKVQNEEKNKATVEAFKFIKGNAAVSTKKGSQHTDITRRDKKETTGLNWGLPRLK